MRIVTLLPSLTELVCTLGRGGDLVGVTHECDFPPEVAGLPHLTRSRIPGAATGGEIDALVSQERGSLYELDQNLLAALEPDLILTQEQCDVCAVNEQTVRRAAMALRGQPFVESVNPRSLAEVHAMFRRVGDLIGSRAEADRLVASFESKVRQIADWRALGSSREHRPRVLFLEWIDPPFCAGHWIPELVGLAGGIEVVGGAGQESRRIDWDEAVAGRPEIILISPCGFSLERAQQEFQAVLASREGMGLRKLCAGRVFLIDGSAYFSRPGPRLEASLAIAAAAINDASCLEFGLPEGDGWRSLGSVLG
jgi:iron complex transport system substrate-binding protein